MEKWPVYFVAKDNDIVLASSLNNAFQRLLGHYGTRRVLRIAARLLI